jgi:hypothetical protein
VRGFIHLAHDGYILLVNHWHEKKQRLSFRPMVYYGCPFRESKV